LYRDTRISQQICTRMAKTAPCFAPSGWYSDSALIWVFCSSLHSSATFTHFIAGPL
jgi:hypothetical protein